MHGSTFVYYSKKNSKDAKALWRTQNTRKLKVILPDLYGIYMEIKKKKHFVFASAQKDPDQCIPSRIITNHTLRGGKTAGELKELGIAESVEDCIEKCCGEKTCEVAFLVDSKCHSVECYGDELCQSLPVEDEEFSPTVVFMNKRNGKRMKDKGKASNYFRNQMFRQVNVSFLLCSYQGTCNSPCVSGVCTAKEKCTCDRGFEGPSCNDTATEGKLTNAFLCWEGGRLVVSALASPFHCISWRGHNLNPSLVVFIHTMSLYLRLY